MSATRAPANSKRLALTFGVARAVSCCISVETSNGPGICGRNNEHAVHALVHTMFEARAGQEGEV
ncbi:MAG: hypothetical protein JO320_04855 [Alphaproteobacteria bacterium]|nr:hypothetical protein [Alphaproteobacteria bacterium]